MGFGVFYWVLWVLGVLLGFAGFLVGFSLVLLDFLLGFLGFVGGFGMVLVYVVGWVYFEVSLWVWVLVWRAILFKRSKVL